MVRTLKKSFAIFALAAPFAFVRAFENKPGWKLDAEGKLELKDGNPIYIDANGREMTVAHDTISRLNGEAKTHREAKEAAETKLKAFEGIDPEAARKAIETVKNIDAKKLIDAGDVEKVKDEIKAEFATQLSEKDKRITELQSSYDGLQIGNIFSTSDFIREKVAMPRDFFEAAMRPHFKVGDDGKIWALDRAGNRLMSKKNVGDYAAPDEALELLVDAHPQKDTILKAVSASGSGNLGNGGNRGAGRVIKRGEYDKLPGHEQAALAVKASKGELDIVD